MFQFVWTFRLIFNRKIKKLRFQIVWREPLAQSGIISSTSKLRICLCFKLPDLKSVPTFWLASEAAGTLTSAGTGIITSTDTGTDRFSKFCICTCTCTCTLTRFCSWNFCFYLWPLSLATSIQISSVHRWNRSQAQAQITVTCQPIYRQRLLQLPTLL